MKGIPRSDAFFTPNTCEVGNQGLFFWVPVFSSLERLLMVSTTISPPKAIATTGQIQYEVKVVIRK